MVSFENRGCRPLVWVHFCQQKQKSHAILNHNKATSPEKWWQEGGGGENFSAFQGRVNSEATDHYSTLNRSLA